MNPAKVAAVVVGGLVLQVCLFASFSFEGARPDVMILLAIAAGFIGGPDRGAIVGFTAGLAYDVVLSTPLGLTALVYTLVGYLVGTISAGILKSSRWVGPAIAAGASAAGMLLYAVVGTLLGQSSFDGPSLGAIITVVAVINALFAPFAIRAIRWASDETSDRPGGRRHAPRLHRSSRFDRPRRRRPSRLLAR